MSAIDAQGKYLLYYSPLRRTRQNAARSNKFAKGKRYNRADVLAFVSEISGEQYDAIEFVSYTDWLKHDAVAPLMNEYEAAYAAACDRFSSAVAEIDAKRKEAAKVPLFNVAV